MKKEKYKKNLKYKDENIGGVNAKHTIIDCGMFSTSNLIKKNILLEYATKLFARLHSGMPHWRVSRESAGLPFEEKKNRHADNIGHTYIHVRLTLLSRTYAKHDSSVKRVHFRVPEV